MKAKVIILLVSLFSLAGSVHAQTQFGLRGGLNYTTVEPVGDPVGSLYNAKYKPTFHIGVFGKIGLSDKLSLNPDLLYTDKGFWSEGMENATPAGDATLHLRYINLPVLLGYKVGDKLTFKLGPELGYLLSARSTFDSETINVEYLWENKLDFGLAAGIDYALSDKVSLELRYTRGFSSVIGDFIDIGRPEPSGTSFQNRSLQLSLAYRLY